MTPLKRILDAGWHVEAWVGPNGRYWCAGNKTFHAPGGQRYRRVTEVEDHPDAALAALWHTIETNPELK